jgi:Calcineurin-like phosphoesterase
MPRPEFVPLSEPIFAESTVTTDPKKFKVDHPSDAALYKQLQDLLSKDVVSFDPPRGQPSDLFPLQQSLGSQGPQIIRAIQSAGQIVFHSVGDTGASNQKKFGNELSAADQMTADFHSADDANRPAFFYHLGDVVYDFGESTYYYDQFYEPYRNYPAPIFSIPGNHDSFIVPGTPAGSEPLTIFSRNFCASSPAVTKEAGSLHRTAMTQPGVYFTLDAPFVRIIGLFSNALEDPGLISSQNGKWSAVPDTQLAFLTVQLQRIKKEKYSGAVLLATHHPPFCYTPAPKSGGAGGNHSSSTDMLADIDTICKQVGVYPHAFLSGHAHNYQRFTRSLTFAGKSIEVPFIICGDGGHNVNSLVQGKKGQPAQEPRFGTSVHYMDVKPVLTSQDLLLNYYDDKNYGFLRIVVEPQSLQIAFHQVGTTTITQSRVDLVTVDLSSHTLTSNS